MKIIQSSIESRMKNILYEQLRVTPAEIKPDSLLGDDLGADSLDIVEIVMALEDEFEIEIPDSDVTGFDGQCTFGKICDYVRKATKE